MEMIKKQAFTLAEVLITLGIIGVVAAMTLPTLTAKYQKIVVTAKLKKFYSVMQQAIRLEENNSGDLNYWLPAGEDFETWFNQHLADKIPAIYREQINDSIHSYKVGLKDGSGFIAYTLLQRIHFSYCTELKHCTLMNKFDGKNTFLFSLCLNEGFVTSQCTVNIKDTSREGLLRACTYGNTDNSDVSIPDKRHDCARLIQYDGWEIKDDYPWKQVMLENQ